MHGKIWLILHCSAMVFPMNTQEVVGGGGVQGRGTVGDCEPKQWVSSRSVPLLGSTLPLQQIQTHFWVSQSQGTTVCSPFPVTAHARWWILRRLCFVGARARPTNKLVQEPLLFHLGGRAAEFAISEALLSGQRGMAVLLTCTLRFKT